MLTCTHCGIDQDDPRANQACVSHKSRHFHEFTGEAMATETIERRKGSDIIRERFNGARCMWEARVPRVGMLTCYYIGKSLFIVQDFDKGGWEVFSPTTTEGIIELTIEAMAVLAFGDKDRRQ